MASFTDGVLLLAVCFLSIELTHGCIHDSLKPEVHNGHQDYGSQHPFLVADRKRRLEESGQFYTLEQAETTEFAPIRITPYYDNSSLDTLPDGEREVVFRVINEAVERFQRTLQVVPVQGSLKVERSCNSVWMTVPRVCYDFVQDETCLEMPIPEEHFAATRYCNTCRGTGCSVGDCSYSAAGAGAPATDFLIYVRADATEYCDGGTIAYATACAKDQFDRPTFGMTNFCPSWVSTAPEDFEGQVATAMHEITHALGFSSQFFPLMRFEDGTPRTPRDEQGNPPVYTTGTCPNGRAISYYLEPDNNTVQHFTERDHVVAKMVTPKVAEFVQAHFACPSLAGAELESADSGCVGSHWEERLFEPEYMSPVDSFRNIYSALTLAFFEDSGWYRANASAAERLVFGEKRGCDFATDKCIDPETATPLEASHYCTNDDAQSCSVDATSRSVCGISDSMGTIPEEFQYFPGQPTKGGWGSFADYCPINMGFSGGNCMDEANLMALGSTGINMFGETYCPTCKCTASSLRGNDSTGWTANSRRQTGCYAMQCYVNAAGDAASIGLTILRTMTNDTVQVNCTAKGEKMAVSGFSGTIACPDPFVICGVGWPEGSVIPSTGTLMPTPTPAPTQPGAENPSETPTLTEAPSISTMPDPTTTPTPTLTIPAKGFEGHYNRTALYPTACGWSDPCDVECSKSYLVVVANETATIASTTDTEDCSCDVLVANITGDSVVATSVNATFVVSLTSTGIAVETNRSGISCVGIYDEIVSGSPTTLPTPTPTVLSGAVRRLEIDWAKQAISILVAGLVWH